MIEKRLLVPARVRTPPGEGFSWVDRRFLRDHAPGLSRDALFLYFFLAAVSDKLGLSFWSDARTSGLLKLDCESVVRARGELVQRDLVAYLAPLTQVLSLPEARVQRSSSGTETLAEILRRLAGGVA